MAAEPTARTAPNDALARLQARFVDGLAGRWQEIAEAPDGPAREAALHRLAGAAGSYGLHALGDAARRAEQALQAGDAAALTAALAALQACLREAATVR